jgi:hypothetical protein
LFSLPPVKSFVFHQSYCSQSPARKSFYLLLEVASKNFLDKKKKKFEILKIKKDKNGQDSRTIH